MTTEAMQSPEIREPAALPSAEGTTTLFRISVILIILLGAWLRFDTAFSTVVVQPIRADAAKYVSYAYNINHFSIYSHAPSSNPGTQTSQPVPDALVTPGYPAFLALLLGKGEVDWSFVKRVLLAQVILGTLTIWLVYIISRQLMPKPWTLLPTFLTAISPKLIIAGSYLLTETLFTASLMALYSWLFLSKSRNASRIAIAGGVLLGIAALVRPTLQYAIPFILAGALPLIARGARWKYSIAMCFGFLLMIAPWAIRNSIVTGHASDPTLTISALVHGHYPNMMFNSLEESKGYPYRFDPQIAELTVSIPAALGGIAERITQSPAQYLRWYAFGKPIAFLSWNDPAAFEGVFTYPVLASPYHESPLHKWTLSAMESTHWLWIILAAGTVVYVLLPRRLTKVSTAGLLSLRVMAMVTIYFLLVHVVGFPIARYSTPLLPTVFILAGYGMHRLLQRNSHNSTRIASAAYKPEAPPLQPLEASDRI